MADPQNEDVPPRRQPDESQQWHHLAAVGMEFAVAVVIFGLLGWWIDQKLDTTPWLMVVGIVLGFVAGMWLMIKTAFRSFK